MSMQSDGHHSRPHIREMAPEEMDEDHMDGSHNYPPLVEEPGKGFQENDQFGHKLAGSNALRHRSKGLLKDLSLVSMWLKQR